MTTAEALARALHPERDWRVGDWGSRAWSTMKPEWRDTAIARASEAIKQLEALGFMVRPVEAPDAQPSSPGPTHTEQESE